MKDLPHHVPIRKENRWEPVQHYATAPNTALASIPARKEDISDILMPKRQESISSYISQCSPHTRQRHSSISRDGTEDESTATPNPNLWRKRGYMNGRNTSSSVLSSQNSTYASRSNSPLVTTFEEHQQNVEKRNSIGPRTTQPHATADWFQHSDDSSTCTSQGDEHSSITKPCEISNASHEYILPPSRVSPQMRTPIVTEESVKRVLRESAPHSRTMPCDQTSVSEGSTKLVLLRERMKRLRERNHHQRSQSRSQLQENNASGDTTDVNRSPSLTRNKSLLVKSTASESFSKLRNSPSQRSLKMVPKAVNKDWDTQDQSHSSQSDSWSLDSEFSTESPEPIQRTEWENGKSSFVPHSPLASGYTSIAEEEVDEVVEKGREEDAAIDYDPAFDPDLDINSSFDSCKRESDEQIDSELDEDLYINSSFDSSKCSSIAEQVVESLRAERLIMNPQNTFSAGNPGQSLQNEASTQRQYDSSIQITRQFSIGNSSRKVSSPSSSPTSSRLQKKLERRGRRPKPVRSPKAKQKSGSSDDMPREAKNLAKELHEALSARGPVSETEEESNHPWADPVQSDGILPLASEDSLSTPVRSQPRSFEEKRRAYLEQVGDPEESRRQSSYTTATWVLGKLPKNPPIRDTADERDEPECSEAKDCDGKPRKYHPRNSRRTNECNVSPHRGTKKLRSPTPRRRDDDSRNAGRHTRPRRIPPVRETGKNDSSEQNWAQNSFVNRSVTSPKPKKIHNRTPPSRRRFVKSKSSREIEDDDASKTSSKRRVSKERDIDERDETPRRPSSRSLIREPSEDWDELSKEEASVRSFVRSKSSKEKQSDVNASSRRQMKRQSSLDQPGQRNTSELSKKLLGTDKKTINGKLKKKSSKRSVQSQKKISSERGRETKKSPKNKKKASVGSRQPDSSSRKPLRSPSLKPEKRTSSSRKPLRSPSLTPEKRRDRYLKKCGEMDITTRVSNATTNTEKPSSWRAQGEIKVEKLEKEIGGTPQTPLARRFGSRLRNLSKERSAKKASATKSPSSGRFSLLVNRFSTEKEDDSKSHKGSYTRLGGSSLDDPDDCSPTAIQTPLSRRSFAKSHRFRSSKKLIFNETSVDKRDDSNRSISNKSKSPSSWRDDASRRSVSRSHSLQSNAGTLVTVESDSDPSSNDSSSEEDPVEFVVTQPDDKRKVLVTCKNGQRTRPRRNTSHRSTMRRFQRYKDYRKNGVLVGEQNRFHIDMTGGMQ